MPLSLSPIIMRENKQKTTKYRENQIIDDLTKQKSSYCKCKQLNPNYNPDLRVRTRKSRNYLTMHKVLIKYIFIAKYRISFSFRLNFGVKTSFIFRF